MCYKNFLKKLRFDKNVKNVKLVVLKLLTQH